jgi:putative ABC transport system substrate-binding protein
MRRRDFITLVGGSVAAWPLAARAQQAERMRRIGVLMGIAEDAEGHSRLAAFRQALRALGWSEGGNIEFNYRWGGGNPEQNRGLADELLEWRPEAIL